MKAYQHHPAQRDVPEAPVIWQRGTTKLRDYNPKAGKGARVVLVIPSLINRYDILDLDHDHSLLRFMAGKGLRPLLVDWGSPGDEESAFTLTDYINLRLLPVLKHATATTPSCHVLGYCMGGLLALALGILARKHVTSLSLMATPWDFSEEDGAVFRLLAHQVEPWLAEFGYLPVEVLHALFMAFQPTQGAKKFARFAAMDSEGTEARRFVLTEDWLNDGVPLTAPVARTCLRDWYGANDTGDLRWRVGESVIDPRALGGMPSYVVVPGKDKIVTPSSARALAWLLPNATLHEPDLGHIGLLASKTAPQVVWEPLIRWILKR